jgi:hypothetical protein
MADPPRGPEPADYQIRFTFNAGRLATVEFHQHNLAKDAAPPAQMVTASAGAIARIEAMVQDKKTVKVIVPWPAEIMPGPADGVKPTPLLVKVPADGDHELMDLIEAVKAAADKHDASATHVAPVDTEHTASITNGTNTIIGLFRR